MSVSQPPTFQIHWSPVARQEAPGLALPNSQLLAVWPAPVNHDVCFEHAGFTLFADNDAAWDQDAETLLARVIEYLSPFGQAVLVSKPLLDDVPWYRRPFQTPRILSVHQQALLPMQCDCLPAFYALFGNRRAALRTSDEHFLMWINLPLSGPDTTQLIKSISGTWPVHQPQLRWHALIPSFIS